MTPHEPASPPHRHTPAPRRAMSVGSRGGIKIALLIVALCGVPSPAWAWESPADRPQPEAPPREPVAGKPENSPDVAALREQNRLLLEQVALLREQNDVLSKQVADLSRDLAGVSSQIKELRGLIARVLRLNDGDKTSESPRLPNDPLASPDAMLSVLRERYVRAFSEDVGRDEGARRERLREIERWVRDVNRTVRGKARWLVRVEEFEPSPRGLAVKYRVLDGATREPIGGEVSGEAPGAFAERIRSGGKGMLYEAGVVVTSAVQFSQEPLEVGVFGLPVLVGPHAAFGCEVEWVSLEAIRGERPGREDRPAPIR